MSSEAAAKGASDLTGSSTLPVCTRDGAGGPVADTAARKAALGMRSKPVQAKASTDSDDSDSEVGTAVNDVRKARLGMRSKPSRPASASSSEDESPQMVIVRPPGALPSPPLPQKASAVSHAATRGMDSGSDEEDEDGGELEDFLEDKKESSFALRPAAAPPSFHHEGKASGVSSGGVVIGVTAGDLFEDGGADSEHSRVGAATAFLDDSQFEQWEHLKTLKIVFNRAGLDAAQQKRFLAALTTATYYSGDYIVRQGDNGDAFYIITSGEVAVTKNGEGEGCEESIITHLYEGHFFGETSLVTAAPRNANVRVVSSSVVVQAMRKEDFTPFLETDAAFRALITELVRKKEETAKRRAVVLATVGVAAVSADVARNEVKISAITSKGRTANGNSIVNGYVLMQKLGSGAYGIVYLALTLAEGKKFAIKVISRAALRKGGKLGLGKGAASAPGDDMHLLLEVAVMKKLAHPNLTALVEVLDDGGDKYYLVQEFMELGAVMTEVEYSHPLAPEVARAYLRGALDGLMYLHFQGVVHRDIKPSNILVDGEGEAKLADFGAAAVLKNPADDTLSDVKGTPAFMPPEVFLLDSATAATYHGYPVDVWSLGATLHCMVVGVPPYMAATEWELVEKLKTEEFRLSAAVALDPHLRNMLMRCLTKDPSKRITVRELAVHPWVTEEGSKPMPLRAYARLNLHDVKIVSATAKPSTPDSTRPRAVTTTTNHELAVAVEEAFFTPRNDPSPNASSALSLLPTLSSPVLASKASLLVLRPSAAGGTSTASEKQKAHLRLLRLRQHQLLRGHTTLTSREQDLLADQKRVAFHASRAEASVEELYMDAAGMFEDAKEVAEMHSLSRASSTADADAVTPTAPRTGGLVRKTDFLMLTTQVEATGDAGGSIVRKVIFRAKGEEGSLSITGGRSGAAKAGGTAERSNHSLGTTSSSIHISHGSVASLAAIAEDGDAPSAVVVAGSDSDSSGESSDGDSDTAYDGIASLDADFSGGGAKSGLAAGLQAVLDELSMPGGHGKRGGVDGGESEEDLDFVSFTQEDQVAWVGAWAEGLRVSYEGAAATPEGVGAAQAAQLALSSTGKSAGRAQALNEEEHRRQRLMATKDADKVARTHARQSGSSSDGSDAEDMLDEGSDSNEEVGDLDDWGLPPSAKRSKPRKATLPIVLAQEGGAPPVTWDAQVLGTGRFVFCPIGSNASLCLTYGCAERTGRRATMEDRIAAVPSFAASLGASLDAAYFAVYDGHNGAGVADRLAQSMHVKIAGALGLAQGACSDPCAAFSSCSAELDAELSRDVQLGESIAGSTACMLLVTTDVIDGTPRRVLTLANVGDSRAVLCREGAAVDLSSDHKCTRPDERERILAAGGTVVKDRLHGILAVSRAFGDAEHKRPLAAEIWGKPFAADPCTSEPEVTVEVVAAGPGRDEFVVIACDGVWDVMSSGQAVAFVRRKLLEHRDVGRAAVELAEKALALGTIDNVSVVVVGLT